MTIWLTIFGMAAVTYLTRVIPFVALRGPIPAGLRRWLGFVPPAVFTALVLPALLVQSGPNGATLVLGPAIPAGIVGALIAWRGGNILLTIGGGLATFWLLRALGI